MSQDPNLPGGVTDRMLGDEAIDPCVCGHENEDHDHDTADGNYGEPYVVTLACEAKGCPCKKFRRAD